MNKAIIYTIRYAVNAEDTLGDTDSPLDQLRQYGSAEIVHVEVVDGSYDDAAVGAALLQLPKS